MLEFEDFVYLDVQKTGSTTIRRFFSEFARTPIVGDNKHNAVKRRDDAKLYIISCRDPLKQYLSLYSHGNASRGGLRRRLEKADMAHLYDGTNEGFTAWLELLLDPVASRTYLMGKDNSEVLEFVGLQSLRFLRLAFASPRSVLTTLKSRDDIKERLNTDALYTVILKTETLTADLIKLITGEHSGLFKQTAEAEKFLTQDRKQNVSTNPGIDLTTLSSDIVARVQERDWLYFEELGYAPYVP